MRSEDGEEDKKQQQTDTLAIATHNIIILMYELMYRCMKGRRIRDVEIKT